MYTSGQLLVSHVYKPWGKVQTKYPRHRKCPLSSTQFIAGFCWNRTEANKKDNYDDPFAHLDGAVEVLEKLGIKDNNS